MAELKDSGARRGYIKRHPGDRVGQLTLIERQPKGHKWSYLCDCGNTGVFQVSSGMDCCPVCSRKRVSQRMLVHGESPNTGKNATRLYRIWLTMKTRCNNQHTACYALYGGRGITVCDQWNNYMVFREWALANGYLDSLTIDRVDVNAGYSPDNCRWTTQKEQCRNKRDNHLITFNEETKTMVEWSEISGIKYHTLKRRINEYGFTAEQALTTPAKLGNNQSLRSV